MSRFIAPFMRFFAQATDAPLEYGEGAALMALSTIALGRRWIDRGTGINANLYMMIVGDSSVARKSTSVNFAKKMVDLVEPVRVGPSDYTMEGLMKWMGEAPDGQPKGSSLKQNRVALFSDEFGADLARMEAYGPTMQSDFCKLYDGESFSKVRVASAPLTVTRPRVSLFAAAAYQMIQQHLQAKDWTNGFLMRFLYVAPRKMRTKFFMQPLWPGQTWDAAQQALTGILGELTAPNASGTIGYPLAVDAAAFHLYVSVGQYFDSILHSLQFIGQTYVERFKTSIQKVALLYQIDEDSTQPIGASAMQKAIDFCGQVCWASFLVAHEKTTSGEFPALAEMILQIVTDAGGSMPIRDLAARFPNNRQVLKVIEYMFGVGHAIRKKAIVAGQPLDIITLTS